MTDAASIQSVKEPAPGYNDLKFYFANLNTMFSIKNTLATDMMTVMASGGLKRRINDISAITKRIYAETTTPSVTNLLDKVENEAAKNPDNWNEWDKANLAEMRRIHSHFSSLPPELYIASVQVSNEGRRVHAQVLKDGDWNKAQPYIEKVIDLYRKIADLKQKKFDTPTPYRALLLGYASDISTRQMDDLYENLLQSLKPLYAKAKEKQESDGKALSLEGECTRADIMGLNKAVLNTMGFDFNRGRLQISNLSPMASGNPDDVRVLVRCGDKQNLLDSLSDTLYQGARGLYYQNLPADWITQPVGQDQGSVMLNALSILYSRMIGQTEDFFDFIVSKSGGSISSLNSDSFNAQNLFKLKNEINHTAVRNDADDFTKVFHDIIRYRIERDILNDALDIKDIPERWNAESKDLLGLEPSSLSDGALQNPDWFTGRFGFIPTNTLSQIMAAEFHQTLGDDANSLSKVGAWAKTNIHSVGHLHGPFETIQNILGRDLDAQALVNYFESRYLA